LHRNCLLKHIIGGKIEGRIQVMGGRGRRSKQLLDDLKVMSRYCKLEEEALDRTLWITRFRRGYGPVIRQITERMWFSENTTFTSFISLFHTPKTLTQNIFLA
jgi:hypothetical protein